MLAHVEDPAVAALLIAKTSLAVERGVDLGIAADSSLPRLDPEASTDVGTVLGNLVDNAVDASCRWAARRSRSRCASTATSCCVAVADTGPACPPDEVGRIFRRGCSSKAADARDGVSDWRSCRSSASVGAARSASVPARTARARSSRRGCPGAEVG